MSGRFDGAAPGPQSRGMVVCTLVLLAVVGLYTAAYRAVAWMWLVWAFMALVSVVLVVTDRPRP